MTLTDELVAVITKAMPAGVQSIAEAIAEHLEQVGHRAVPSGHITTNFIKANIEPTNPKAYEAVYCFKRGR